MSKFALRAMLAVGAVAILAPSAAQAWTKSYVVEWFEPAFHYGGPKNGAEETPGTDCPTGANTLDIPKEVNQPYRSKELQAHVLNPENGIGPIINTFGFRGPNAELIYANPTTRPDPGWKEVQGKVAEGFNLDGDEKTGFDGVDGAAGVDNGYYKVAGCVERWRGHPQSSHTAKFHMEIMREGAYTVLIVAHGKGQDPNNDDDITVGFYTSQDDMVKDGTGIIAADYTFRIEADPTFQTVFKARTRGGILEAKETVPLLRTHDTMQTRNDNPWMNLYQAKIRFDISKDGQIVGHIGGYRNWFELFRNPLGNSGNGRRNGGGHGQGAIAERLSHFNSVPFYYSLRRNADGLKDPETRQNHGISAAYRYYLRPAFVVSPRADERVEMARVYDK